MLDPKNQAEGRRNLKRVVLGYLAVAGVLITGAIVWDAWQRWETDQPAREMPR